MRVRSLLSVDLPHVATHENMKTLTQIVNTPTPLGCTVHHREDLNMRSKNKRNREKGIFSHTLFLYLQRRSGNKREKRRERKTPHAFFSRLCSLTSSAYRPPRVISSRCVPCSTTPPFSNT